MRCNNNLTEVGLLPVLHIMNVPCVFVVFNYPWESAYTSLNVSTGSVTVESSGT